MKFLSSSVTVLVLAAFSSASIIPKSVDATSTYTLCGDPSTHLLAVTSADYNPKPPVAGKPLTVAVAGDLKANIDQGASIKVTVSAGGLTVWQDTYDVCQEAEKIGKSCPLAPGPYEFSKSVTVPSIIPPGTYTLKAAATTVDGKAITCIEDKFTI
ncbi:ML domain-containing protein [Cunninghamella echinulata]|nr:ML domain-containing protein [Cunninghamella echinulata]